LALRYPAKPSPAKPSSIIGLGRGRCDGTHRHADNRVIRECRVIDREVGSACALRPPEISAKSAHTNVAALAPAEISPA
jgi:hypothetical protein